MIRKVSTFNKFLCRHIERIFHIHRALTTFIYSSNEIWYDICDWYKTIYIHVHIIPFIRQHINHSC